jgi:hypothetical protein
MNFGCLVPVLVCSVLLFAFSMFVSSTMISGLFCVHIERLVIFHRTFAFFELGCSCFSCFYCKLALIASIIPSTYWSIVKSWQ